MSFNNISGPSRFSTTKHITIRRLERIKKIFTASVSSVATDLRVSAEDSMVDEKVELSVRGLQQGQKVTLHTLLTDSGIRFASKGHFIANEHGQVSTFHQPSVGGSYTGLEPMGLFWSLRNTPEGRNRRLFKTDITQPFDMTVVVQNGFSEDQDIPDLTQVSHKSFKRHYLAPGVRRIPVEEDGIYGTLFLPPGGDGPFPTIFDLLGFGGGIQEHRSSLLASKGFATFTLAYVNHKDCSKDGTDLDYNCFLKGFDWLSRQAAVNAEAMGTLVSCVGGGYGMLLASLRPNVKCMVNINGLGYPVGPSQTVEGDHCEFVFFDPRDIVQVDGEASFKKMSNSTLSHLVSQGWRHGAKILFLTGDDDQCVDPQLKEKIKAAIPPDFAQNMTYVTYPEAGHLIEPPYGPVCRSCFNTIFGVPLLWGGQAKPHADAQEDSWERMIQFYKEHLMSSPR